MAVGGAAARLDELLDQIRLAFESVSQDVEHSKSQHNDYERRGWILFWCCLHTVSAQAQEMTSIRTHIYELEKLHSRIKQEYGR